MTSLSEGLPNALCGGASPVLPVVSAIVCLGCGKSFMGIFREAEAQKEVFLGLMAFLSRRFTGEGLSVRWEPEGEALCGEEADKSFAAREKSVLRWRKRRISLRARF